MLLASADWPAFVGEEEARMEELNLTIAAVSPTWSPAVEGLSWHPSELSCWCQHPWTMPVSSIAQLWLVQLEPAVPAEPSSEATVPFLSVPVCENKHYKTMSTESSSKRTSNKKQEMSPWKQSMQHFFPWEFTNIILLSVSSFSYAGYLQQRL